MLGTKVVRIKGNFGTSLSSVVIVDQKLYEPNFLYLVFGWIILMPKVTTTHPIVWRVIQDPTHSICFYRITFPLQEHMHFGLSWYRFNT